jgi:hypothetical protein
MPTLYVTYHDPLSDAITTAAVETPLAPRVFRAMILAEGLALPDGRAVLPSCLRGVSERRPVEQWKENGYKAYLPEPEPPRPPAEAPTPAPVVLDLLAAQTEELAPTLRGSPPPPQRVSPAQPKSAAAAERKREPQAAAEGRPRTRRRSS